MGRKNVVIRPCPCPVGHYELSGRYQRRTLFFQRAEMKNTCPRVGVEPIKIVSIVYNLNNP